MLLNSYRIIWCVFKHNINSYLLVTPYSMVPVSDISCSHYKKNYARRKLPMSPLRILSITNNNLLIQNLNIEFNEIFMPVVTL